MSSDEVFFKLNAIADDNSTNVIQLSIVENYHIFLSSSMFGEQKIKRPATGKNRCWGGWSPTSFSPRPTTRLMCFIWVENLISYPRRLFQWCYYYCQAMHIILWRRSTVLREKRRFYLWPGIAGGFWLACKFAEGKCYEEIQQRRNRLWREGLRGLSA